MATANLTVLSAPYFPQVFDALIDRQIRLVDDVLAQTFPMCSWETPETARGRCDGGMPCFEQGTVSQMEDQQAYCVRHFREVSR